jgi:hypothetical protein
LSVIHQGGSVQLHFLKITDAVDRLQYDPVQIFPEFFFSLKNFYAKKIPD